jgi:hypothetical protein
MKNSISLKPWGVKNDDTLAYYPYFWSSTLIGIHRELRQLFCGFFENKKQHMLLSQDDTKAVIRELKQNGACISSGIGNSVGKKEGVPYPDPLLISDLKGMLSENSLEIIGEKEEDYTDLKHCFCLTYKQDSFFILLFSRKNMSIVVISIINGSLLAEFVLDYDLLLEITEKDKSNIEKNYPYDSNQTHTKKINMMFNSFIHVIWANIAIGTIDNSKINKTIRNVPLSSSYNKKTRSFVKYGMQYGPKCGKCIECIDKSRKKMCVVRAARREEERKKETKEEEEEEEEEEEDLGSVSDSSVSKKKQKRSHEDLQNDDDDDINKKQKN